ncbi:MAG: hypothetical protein GYA24_04605 [Candidatus Lokiarchaeota archaeon]|nr:hypothetical protein [Candidatus Lokiarchaeota archaeon]
MDEKLIRFGRIFASKSDYAFLIQKATEQMAELDKECQDDRMTCTVRPLCEKRRWLSILIKAGAPMAMIPKFCYELQQKIVDRALKKEKYFYEPEDCAIYLDDFFLLVSKSSPYMLAKMLENNEYEDLTFTLESFFRSRFNRVMSLNLEDNLVLLADETLWYIDYIGKLVVLNINDERLLNQATLLSLLKFFSRYYKIEIKIFEGSPESWILDMVLFEIKSPDISQNESLKAFLAEAIGKLTRLVKEVNFKIDENKAHLLVKINAFCGIPESLYAIEPVTYGEAKRAFLGLVEFKKKMDAWVSANLK